MKTDKCLEKALVQLVENGDIHLCHVLSIGSRDEKV